MLLLDQVLGLNIMKKAIVVNESLQTKEHIIDYISVQEPPVEGFIRKNEMVLSTALGLEDESSLMRFVKNAYQLKATALVLAFNPQTNQYISQEIIDFADSVQFPLIKIPWEVRFSDISKAVMDELQKIKNKQEAEYAELQKELLHTYFNEGSLEDAAELVANTTNQSIIIMDKDRNIKGSTLLNNQDVFHEIQIEVSNYLYGYLSISQIISDKNDVVNFDFFNFYINVPLSLWFEKEEVINTTSLNVRNDFIWQLANEKSDPKKLFSHGIQLGFNMDLPYFCVVLQIHGANHGESYTDNFLTIENRMIALIKEHNLETMIGLENNKFILFIESQKDLDVSKLLDKIEENILDIYPDYKFTWGIDDKPHTKHNFFEQHKKASIALQQALFLKSSRLNFKKSQLSRMIHQIINRETIIDEAQSFFAPIESNSRFNSEGMNLIHTIAIYIQTNFNTSQTAREINIHRQSLLYRLEKFEKLTDRSLNDCDDLFLIEYYLRLLGKF